MPDVALPPQFVGPGPGGSVVVTDNTPAANRTTNAGATLGRVLFYDVRLSANDRISCASCHQQAFAFGDTARLSRGFKGGFTRRHAMGLANARFYQRGRFFWDERAATLEAQVLMPIQDTTEMGMTLSNLVAKVGATKYYPTLFQAVFGTPQVTSDRIAAALAQFVRSIESYQSKFDQAFVGMVPGGPNFGGALAPDEALGQQLFVGVGRCAQCHATNAQVSDDVHNTGLDAISADTGAGGARFKAPSLRNIGVRAPYMHDGRFGTLAQVVEHYDSGIQGNLNLDRRLRGPNGAPQRLNLTAQQRSALVAYLNTLTDQTLLTAAKFSNPFPPQ
jgi:cytochrome c peroxidase